jgi:peroxisomal membrane protein 2
MWSLRYGTVVFRRSRQRTHTSERRLSSNAESDINPLRRAFVWYANKLDTHPLLTKGITSGIIAGSGDFLCQTLISNRDDVWDHARTGRFALLGTVLVAPAIHVWYGALAARWPGTKATVIATRVFWDQFIFTPVFLPVWMGSLWTLEDRHQSLSSDIIPRIANSLPEILVANWALWIPVQAFNFYTLPTKYQVLFSNVVGLLWNAYLSYSTSGHESILLEDYTEAATATTAEKAVQSS